MDVDLTSLLVFRHVARSGSFTEAGRHWKISQPSVSLMVSRLESSVGLILLERSASGTRLTPAGTRFLVWANEVCDAYLAFTEGLRTVARRMDREVSVGVDRSWFGEKVREALAARGNIGGLSVTVCEIGEAWWDGLESSRYDVVVAGRFLQTGLSAGIQEGVIRRERGITVAWNPDFHPFDTEHFSFPEAMRTTVLIPDGGVVTGFSEFLVMWCQVAYGIQPANVLKFSSENEAAEAAAAGLGVFLGPGDAIKRFGPLASGLDHVRTFEFLLPEAFTFGVFCRSGEDSEDVLSSAASIGRMAAGLFPK
jgi:DNA-binding transcriptional LysR family regulator